MSLELDVHVCGYPFHLHNIPIYVIQFVEHPLLPLVSELNVSFPISSLVGSLLNCNSRCALEKLLLISLIVIDEVELVLEFLNAVFVLLELGLVSVDVCHVGVVLYLQLEHLD